MLLATLIGLGLFLGNFLLTMLPLRVKPGYHQKGMQAAYPGVFFEASESNTSMIPEVESGGRQQSAKFEQFIIGLFPSESLRYRVLEWHGNKCRDKGQFDQVCTLPDIEMGLLEGTRLHKFAVECTWRKNFDEGVISWALDYQIEHYLDYQADKRIPVFVAIGIGGSPSHPDYLYLAPLNSIAGYTHLYQTYLKQFARHTKHKFHYDARQKTLS